MAVATLNGVDIFGPLVSVNHVPQPTAQQISAFFGVSGTLAQFGGGRGRGFFVRGCAIAASLIGLREFEMVWGSYADGVARTLVDPYGAVWPYVVFKGEFQYEGRLGWIEGGVCLSYRAVLYGLT